MAKDQFTTFPDPYLLLYIQYSTLFVVNNWVHTTIFATTIQRNISAEFRIFAQKMNIEEASKNGAQN